MTWIVLIASGMLEAVWATALGASKGFSRPVPTIVFVVAMVASMVGLAYAMSEIPTGTAYAVWVGIGATLTVLWAIITGTERVALVRLLLLGALVGAVVGLKVVS
jgi:quaternary ammonium compound-resistance protein SugE